MSSQPIGQWNYIIYFHSPGSFFKDTMKAIDNFKNKQQKCTK